jgi:hypothetical protein
VRFFRVTILFFSALLLGIVSCRDSKELSFWSLIDSNTIIVYESSNPVLIKDGLIDSILQKTTSKQYMACLQSINKNSFDLLYATKVTNKEFEDLNSDQKTSARVLNGVSIYELKKNGKVMVAWANLDGFLVLSKASLLIENTIRVYLGSPSKDFKTQNPKLFDFVTIKSDAGNVWVNHNELSKTSIPLFQILKQIPVFRNLASSSVLDVTRNAERISLSGFTLDSLEKDWGLFRFQNQSPVKIEVMRFVPNASKVFIHYGLSNVDALITGDPDEPIKSDLRNEIGICVLDNNAYVIILKVKEGYAFDKFELIESYAGYDIRKITDTKLTESVNGLLPEVSFNQGVFKDGYIFLSKEMDELKIMIDAIETDETWGRSVDFQQFFNTCLQEGNVSVFYTPSALLGDSIPNEWEPILDSLHLNKLSWGSIQFNSLDNHFFTSANFQFESSKPKMQSDLNRKSYELSNNLAAAYTVKNHTDGSNELLAQDSTYKMFLFSKAEGVQWVYNLNGKIQQVQQLDYFKNGKLQYMVVTANYIYLIDRLGRDVEGFPKKKDLNYRFLEVVDYDKSRNYRIVLTSGDQEIYILDKSLKELEGWSPKKLNARIRFSPKHYRIGGKDYFIVITENGQLHIFNRRGDYEKGFPLTITKNISGDYFVDAGSTLATSSIYFVSDDGIVQRLTLDGKPTNENLVRGSKSIFSLISTWGKSDFYLFRIDSDKIAIFDRNNQLVFERQNPGSQNLKPSAFKSPEGKAYFCFFDEEQKLSYFFNSSGNSIINRPIETTLMPLFEINQKTKQVSVFSIYNNSITNTPLN